MVGAVWLRAGAHPSAEPPVGPVCETMDVVLAGSIVAEAAMSIEPTGLEAVVGASAGATVSGCACGAGDAIAGPPVRVSPVGRAAIVPIAAEAATWG